MVAPTFDIDGLSSALLAEGGYVQADSPGFSGLGGFGEREELMRGPGIQGEGFRVEGS